MAHSSFSSGIRSGFLTRHFSGSLIMIYDAAFAPTSGLAYRLGIDAASSDTEAALKIHSITTLVLMWR